MTAPTCQVPGCGQPATHRYLYRYEPGEGHSVPVHSDVCERHLDAMYFQHRDHGRSVKLEDGR